MYLKEFEDAQSELVKALSIHKTDQTFITLGKIHLMQNDVASAIEVYKQAVA